jgi:hypothetical protein
MVAATDGAELDTRHHARGNALRVFVKCGLWLARGIADRCATFTICHQQSSDRQALMNMA